MTSAKALRARALLAVAVLTAAALAVAAAWLRIAGTTRIPFWLDEGYSAYAAAKGFRFLWQVVPLYETHPPFYYSLLRLWTLTFGDSLVAARALGIACGLATLPVAALAARELARWFPRALRPVPLILAALALIALSPVLIDMARQVRPYPVMILVYATALFALLRLGRIAAGERRIAPAAFALYLAALALLLWLHNLGILYGTALGLALLVLVLRRDLRRRDWILLIGGHLLVALIYLPALAILLDQAPTWIHSTWLRFDAARLPARLTLLWAAPGQIARYAGGALALLGVASLVRLRAGWRVALALLLLAALPVALSILISLLKAPVFITRTMSPVAVPALLLIAVGGGGWANAMRWLALPILLAFAGSMAWTDSIQLHARPMQNWYGAVAWLEQRYRPGDEIWSYPNEGALPLDYAARDKGLAFIDRPIPTPVPTLDGGPGAWNPTGSRGVVSLPPARLRALAQSPAARAVPTIWLHRLGAHAYDKGDVLLRELAVGRVVVGRWTSGPIEIIGLRRRDLVPPGDH
ncbi:MAG TPA: hypothetical protein VNQ31_00680 [Sphingomonadaceae bacterium]|nr:hypothetical protein [Sphingomonadaceae bacterium]